MRWTGSSPGPSPAGRFTGGPLRGQPGGQQQPVSPGQGRAGAAGRLARGQGEGLRGELTGGRLARRAEPGVGEGGLPVAGAQFPEGRYTRAVSPRSSSVSRVSDALAWPWPGSIRRLLAAVRPAGVLTYRRV